MFERLESSEGTYTFHSTSGAGNRKMFFLRNLDYDIESMDAEYIKGGDIYINPNQDENTSDLTKLLGEFLQVDSESNKIADLTEEVAHAAMHDWYVSENPEQGVPPTIQDEFEAKNLRGIVIDELGRDHSLA